MKRASKVGQILNLVSAAVESGNLLYSSHANKRMFERKITKLEVEYVLINGHHEAKKDQYNEQFESWDYAISGFSIDKRNLRIVVALESASVLVVTTIDLDKKD